MGIRAPKQIEDDWEAGLLHAIGCECDCCGMDRWYYQKPWLPAAMPRSKWKVDDGRLVRVMTEAKDATRD